MTGQENYRQLRPEERVALAGMKLQGQSIRAMARRLERAPSTVSRELARNTQDNGRYDAQAAQVLHTRRRRAARPAPKLEISGLVWATVVALLEWKWSPQQIAATLKRVYPNEAHWHMSHETIYTAIYALPRGELRRDLIACLRQGRRARLPRSRGGDRRGQIPEMLSIHVRPPEVEDRLMPGHWEGDLIKGAGNRSAVGVLVERSSRLVLLARLPDASAESALAAFTAKLHQIAAPQRLTLTYDQGREMARHRELARDTNMRVYFCDPHSPWQRGTCENTNGLLRQYLPKGTDLSVHSQDDLDAIADSLNNRPRASLDWLTPLQVFSRTLANAHQPATAIQ